MVRLSLFFLVFVSSWSFAGQASYQSLATQFNSAVGSRVPAVSEMVLGERTRRCFSQKAPTDYRNAKLTLFDRKIRDNGDPDFLSDPNYRQPAPQLSIAVAVDDDSTIGDLVGNGEMTSGIQGYNGGTSRITPLMAYSNCWHGELHFENSTPPSRRVGGNNGRSVVMDLRKSQNYLLVHVVSQAYYQTVVYENDQVSRIDAPRISSSDDQLCYFE